MEQQYGHLEPITADELWIAVHVHDRDRRQGMRAAEFGELVEHLIAEAAAFAADDDEARRQRVSLLPRIHFRGVAGGGAIPKACEAAFEAFTCVAMNFTVFGGTSPTAVIW
jgi:hypothetical protein